MDKKHLWIIVAFFAGVVAASKVRSLPGGSKIPSV
jgi:hypothetical protein